VRCEDEGRFKKAFRSAAGRRSTFSNLTGESLYGSLGNLRGNNVKFGAYPLDGSTPEKGSTR
jgi:hypothetical protein